MSKKSTLKPLAAAMGAAFVTSLATMPVANAADNPFAMSELSNGYMVAEMAEGKCGAGKMKMDREGKCGEGNCGMKMLDANGDGKVTKDEFMSAHEAAFGKKDTNADGVLSASELEGKCGGGKMKKEGKCGEGKCGANKMKMDKEGKCGGSKK